MIEGWQKKWSYDKMKTFSIKLVAPKNILQLLVNVRGVLHIGSSKHNKREIVIPAYTTSMDQQGYYTSQFKITIHQ